MKNDQKCWFRVFFLLSSKRQPHKIVKYNQTIREQQPTNCFSVFNHFVELALKWLIFPDIINHKVSSIMLERFSHKFMHLYYLGT